MKSRSLLPVALGVLAAILSGCATGRHTVADPNQSHAPVDDRAALAKQREAAEKAREKERAARAYVAADIELGGTQLPQGKTLDDLSAEELAGMATAIQAREELQKMNLEQASIEARMQAQRDAEEAKQREALAKQRQDEILRAERANLVVPKTRPQAAEYAEALKEKYPDITGATMDRLLDEQKIAGGEKEYAPSIIKKHFDRVREIDETLKRTDLSKKERELLEQERAATLRAATNEPRAKPELTELLVLRAYGVIDDAKFNELLRGMVPGNTTGASTPQPPSIPRSIADEFFAEPILDE